MDSSIAFDFDLASFLFTIIRVMTPILCAALACMVFRKGGVDGIATEGIMLICALVGTLGSFFFQSAFLGVMTAVFFGVMMSFVYGYITIILKANQILAGIALNIFAGGITIFGIYYATGQKGSTAGLAGPVVPSVSLPVIDSIPYLGRVLSNHNLLTYIAILLVLILYFFLYRTPTGLRIRTVGENPEAAKSVGISILKYKYITLSIAGSMAGLGGAFMTLGYVSFFTRDMIAGRGFIGMAAESMGRGSPIGVLLSSVFFSVFDALGIQLQIIDVPPQLLHLLPYLGTIIAIAFYSYYAKKNEGKPPSEKKRFFSKRTQVIE